MKSTIDQSVERFLCWKLPADFCPDNGISFQRESDYEHLAYGRTKYEPIGTNLLTADQAKAMLEHVTAPLQAEIVELRKENAALLVANRDCVDWFENLKVDYDAQKTELASIKSQEPVGHLTLDGDFIQNQRWVMQFGIVPRGKSLYLAAGAQTVQQEPRAWINYKVIADKNGNFAGVEGGEVGFTRLSYGYDWDKSEPLYLAAGAQPVQQEPFDKDYEREQFEKWYCVEAFDFERDPIGSKLCGDQWAAWKERAKRAAPVQAQERKPHDGGEEFKQYLIDCDKNAIEPDVAGAFNAGWLAAHGIKEQP